MKPSSGDLVRIISNVWENLAAGSYTGCYALKGCVARVISWEEYCEHVSKLGGKNDFDDLKQWMERANRLFTVIIVKNPEILPVIGEDEADFIYPAQVGAAVLLAESEFEILDQKAVSNLSY